MSVVSYDELYVRGRFCSIARTCLSFDTCRAVEVGCCQCCCDHGAQKGLMLSVGTLLCPCTALVWHIVALCTLSASECRNSSCNCLLMRSRGHLCFSAGSSCTGMQRKFLILHLLFSKVHKNLCEESRKCYHLTSAKMSQWSVSVHLHPLGLPAEKRQKGESIDMN